MVAWEGMNLKPSLIKGVNVVYNDFPVSAQQLIASVLQGQDFIVQGQRALGQAGNNRVPIYSIPILQTVDDAQLKVQALILVPNRELALQTQEEISRLAQFVEVDCLACVEGMSLQAAVRQLGVGVQVIVGTVERTLELVQRDALKTDSLKIVVLDGMDACLSSEESREKVEELMRQLRDKKENQTATASPSPFQLLLFTTALTPSKDESAIASSFFMEPIRVLKVKVGEEEEGRVDKAQ